MHGTLLPAATPLDVLMATGGSLVQENSTCSQLQGTQQALGATHVQIPEISQD
jgi:hypothetical protein